MSASAQYFLSFGNQVVAYVCAPLRQDRIVFAEHAGIREPVTVPAPQFRIPKARSVSPA